ncbi:hypothetical protein [Pseudogemmobacter sonorensis]|uniref:hypothetical protein n=1 Tax=Pseudogemmobacter sonorensis TaxID=2989681 RepID=UPI0036991F3C
MTTVVQNDPIKNLFQSRESVLRLIAVAFAVLVLAVNALGISRALGTFFEQQRDPRSWLADEVSALALPDLLFYSGGFGNVAAVLCYALPVLIIAAIAMSVIPAASKYVRLVDLMALCVSLLVILGVVVSFSNVSADLRRFEFTTYGTWATPQNNVREFWLPLVPSWGSFASVLVAVLLTFILFGNRIVTAAGLGVIVLIFIGPMLYSDKEHPTSSMDSLLDSREDEARPYRLSDESIESLMPPRASP